jgi:hypothetical protein
LGAAIGTYEGLIFVNKEFGVVALLAVDRIGRGIRWETDDGHGGVPLKNSQRLGAG